MQAEKAPLEFRFYSLRNPSVGAAAPLLPAPRTEMDVSQSHEGMANKDGVGVEMEEQSVGERCPIAKNAALLEELDGAEDEVAELLEVAAEALDELAGVESLDSAKVEASTKQFLGLVSSVHGTLSSNAALIRDYTPYPRSIYGPRKELELLHEKARFLQATLANLACEEAATAAAAATAAVDTSAAEGSSPSGVVGAITTAAPTPAQAVAAGPTSNSGAAL